MAVAKVSASVPLSWAPIIIESCEEGKRCLQVPRLVLQERNLERREPKSFIMCNKPSWPLLWKEMLSLYWKINKSALCPWGRHYLYFPCLFAIQISLRWQSGEKAASASAHRMYRDMTEPWKITSRHLHVHSLCIYEREIIIILHKFAVRIQWDDIWKELRRASATLQAFSKCWLL